MTEEMNMQSGKWRNLLLLSMAELLAMGLWFSASAVIPQLTVEWRLTPGQQSWMTMSVQIGFVVGALISAVLNLADRIENRHLFAASASAGALVNAAVPLLEPGPDVTLFSAGDAVYYAGDITRSGSNSEFQLVDERLFLFLIDCA